MSYGFLKDGFHEIDPICAEAVALYPADEFYYLTDKCYTCQYNEACHYYDEEDSNLL